MARGTHRLLLAAVQHHALYRPGLGVDWPASGPSDRRLGRPLSQDLRTDTRHYDRVLFAPVTGVFALLVSITGLTDNTVIIPLVGLRMAVLVRSVTEGLNNVPDEVRIAATAMGCLGRPCVAVMSSPSRSGDHRRVAGGDCGEHQPGNGGFADRDRRPRSALHCGRKYELHTEIIAGVVAGRDVGPDLRRDSCWRPVGFFAVGQETGMMAAAGTSASDVFSYLTTASNWHGVEWDP